MIKFIHPAFNYACLFRRVPNAFDASLCLSSNACAYVFKVVCMLACPNMLCVVLTSVPKDICNVAKVCLSSWKRKMDADHEIDK